MSDTLMDQDPSYRKALDEERALAAARQAQAPGARVTAALEWAALATETIRDAYAGVRIQALPADAVIARFQADLTELAAAFRRRGQRPDG
jgi:hypothetical protein